MNNNQSSLEEPVIQTIKRDLNVVLDKAKFYFSNSKPT